MGPIEYFWRGTAAALRRTGGLLVRAADTAYWLGEPKLGKNDRALIKRNEALHDRHRGRRAFVVANGASLRNQDLSLLAGEVTLVMSGFWKHPVVAEWQPTYYCFSDPVFFDGSEPMKQFFESLRQRIHSTTFIAPLQGREGIEVGALLPPQPIFYVAFLQRMLGANAKDEIDLTRQLPWVFTTAQVALMTAVYLGCSPIYLLGFDHDWLVYREYERHFYEGKTISDHPVAHGTYDYPLDSEMDSMLKLWRGYRWLDAVTKSRDVQILNATAGGFLDVFERVPYSSLFELTKAEAQNVECYQPQI